MRKLNPEIRKEKKNARQRSYYAANRKQRTAYEISRYQRTSDRRMAIKIEIFSHYNPQGKVQCSWPDCDVIDLDMLTLDHINNDGADDRRQSHCTGRSLYCKLKLLGYPDGFQTLCHNHQWKKEMNRRREKAVQHDFSDARPEQS